MTKTGSFHTRFPLAGLFFLIAVTLAIPLTVWSMNNASTNVKQQAAITPRVIFYDCKNFEVSRDCGTKTYNARRNNITNKWTINSINMGTYDNWSDKAESIKVVDFPAGYSIRFYENEKWGGNYITVTVSDSNTAEKVPDLSKYWRQGIFISFANQITSFKSL